MSEVTDKMMMMMMLFKESCLWCSLVADTVFLLLLGSWEGKQNKLIFKNLYPAFPLS